ncbi:MAG TPA: hypothetical protein P5079_07480, partial [Elusimicrobiota bacterium]|nr:hypothetical protein [Elusimicrobiota bacterium]
KSKALDGHPTPLTPFIRIATGASGVGVGASIGLAFGAMDTYGAKAPWVHMVEGEGGMTPGRVHEAMAACATSQLYNVVMHVDWNQASIDSNHVCAENGQPGDYVQWTPMELAYLHDWNVIYVPDGKDFRQVFAAQKLANSLTNKMPTAVVYRTVKGWRYGIEGRSSHGAGHKFCSDGYYATLKEFEDAFSVSFPRFSGNPAVEAETEKCFYDTLLVFRAVLEKEKETTAYLGRCIADSKARLDKQSRTVRADAPRIGEIYKSDVKPETPPAGLTPDPGKSITLRDVMGDTLNALNKISGGGIFAASADLMGSTSVSNINKGFPQGFYNAEKNPGSRALSLGGICEDGMGAVMAGLASFGNHIGAISSYAAFIAALEHIAARLHSIGQQSRKQLTGEPFKPFIMINAHAGVKTGEDGPTHADPQPLQLLQENFPKGFVITLTPWDPQEIWPLMIAALKARPAVICPFVTRPAESVPDRKALGLPPAHVAAKGVYAIRTADPKAKQYNGTVVLQGNGVASVFV